MWTIPIGDRAETMIAIGTEIVIPMILFSADGNAIATAIPMNGIFAASGDSGEWLPQ
jgi:hypothetical protein